MIQIYHNSRCQKSRTVLNLLMDSGEEFEIINYLVTRLSVSDLKQVLDKMQITPLELVRKKEKIWQEQFKNNSYSDEELVSILVENPQLIERPIVVLDSTALVVRTDEAVQFLKDILKKDI